jgi:hypothetical protein
MIRFAKEQFPSVDAFWSLTMYNSNQACAQNPINRYTVRGLDELKVDTDGSLPIYIHSARVAWQRQGVKLAARIGGFLQCIHEVLLAQE